MEEIWIEQYIEKFIGDHGREPTDDEIANYIRSAESAYDDYIDGLIDEAKLQRNN